MDPGFLQKLMEEAVQGESQGLGSVIPTATPVLEMMPIVGLLGDAVTGNYREFSRS